MVVCFRDRHEKIYFSELQCGSLFEHQKCSISSKPYIHTLHYTPKNQPTMPKKIEKTTRQTRSSANKNKSSQATRTKTTVVAPTETRSVRSRSTAKTNAGKSKKAVDHKSMTVPELKKEYESRFGKYTGYKPKQELLDALSSPSSASQKTKPVQKPKEKLPKLSQKQPAKKPLSQKAAKQQEQMFEHFVSQDFDIDELVDKVKIPASWKWVGEQGKNIDWMYHLVETD
jgi:hypothetical protein